ncbi:MAG: hypothetical protein MHMPM18_000669 [Marteilia pararefringens]
MLLEDGTKFIDRFSTKNSNAKTKKNASHNVNKSKNKDISREVHSKIVGFLAPKPNMMWPDSKKDQLFYSILQ